MPRWRRTKTGWGGYFRRCVQAGRCSSDIRERARRCTSARRHRHIPQPHRSPRHRARFRGPGGFSARRPRARRGRGSPPSQESTATANIRWSGRPGGPTARLWRVLFAYLRFSIRKGFVATEKVSASRGWSPGARSLAQRRQDGLPSAKSGPALARNPTAACGRQRNERGGFKQDCGRGRKIKTNRYCGKHV